MKQSYSLSLLLLAIIVSACSSTQSPEKINIDAYDFAAAIDTAYIRTHLSVISSDEYEGRDTGSEGIKKAQKYLSEQYSTIGLTPVGDDSTYLQEFELQKSFLKDYSVSFYETEGEEKKLKSLSVTNDQTLAPVTPVWWASSSLEAPVEYVGFGIVNDSVNHTADLDLSGKWAMVSLPPVAEGQSVMASLRPLYGVLIRQAGAQGILIISESDEAYDESAASFQSGLGETLGLELPYLADGETGSRAGRSIANIRPSAAASVLNMSAEEFKAYQEDILEKPESFKGESTGTVLSVEPEVGKGTMLAHNMVALFEGTDPELKDEVIVLTSHYDHIGIGRADSTGDTLYNGADDDGSGTIGLLAAANAMQKAKEAGAEIRRSVLFLHVTAEEKGLLGSRYYSDYPIFPIEKTVANLNADMIGRIGDEYQDSLDQDYVYVIGAEIISSQLDSLLQVGNEKTDNIKLDMRYNDLDHPQQFYRRSDHWNFGRLGVPFAFFFNGTHEDYHRPGDEIHKIAFPQLAQRARVMYGTAIELANWDDRPVVDNQLFIERTQE
jgi:hypothetical protein